MRTGNILVHFHHQHERFLFVCDLCVNIASKSFFLSLLAISSDLILGIDLHQWFLTGGARLPRGANKFPGWRETLRASSTTWKV